MGESGLLHYYYHYYFVGIFIFFFVLSLHNEDDCMWSGTALAGLEYVLSGGFKVHEGHFTFSSTSLPLLLEL